jgi:adenosylmethionine-8-amino-7-oxononanoate aminotransferase
LRRLWKYPNVGDIRRSGLIAAVELVSDWRTRKPLDPRKQAGI